MTEKQFRDQMKINKKRQFGITEKRKPKNLIQKRRNWFIYEWNVLNASFHNPFTSFNFGGGLVQFESV